MQFGEHAEASMSDALGERDAGKCEVQKSNNCAVWLSN